MKWEKLGRILDPAETRKITHAAVPIAMHLQDDIYRIFLSSRDYLNRSFPFFIDFDIQLFKIIRTHFDPIMNLGMLGTFDDSGVMPTCILKKNNELFLYYIGWNTCTTVPFRNSIGLAKSIDNGISFSRIFKGPIIDRNATEPHFCASCDVLYENDKYKIWYLNCIGWEIINSKPLHRYHIKYAESNDGENFLRNGKVAIDFKNESEFAISVPRVLKDESLYKMWYSYRGKDYRIGYAESNDGILWSRKDESVGIDVSQEGWDSNMICYPFVFDHNGKRYLLYNGNGYGKTGFGIAILN